MLHSQGSEDRIELLSISFLAQPDPTQTWHRQSQLVISKDKVYCSGMCNCSKYMSFSARATITNLFPSVASKLPSTSGESPTPWGQMSFRIHGLQPHVGPKHAQQRTLLSSPRSAQPDLCPFEQVSINSPFYNLSFCKGILHFLVGFPTTGTFRIKVFWKEFKVTSIYV